jgi:hypothetical protein
LSFIFIVWEKSTLRLHRYVFITLFWLLATTLGCSLATSPDENSPDVAPANNENWVSFGRNNLIIGAPPSEWLQVPAEQGAIDSLFTNLSDQDLSVAYLFLGLGGVAKNPTFPLVLMKNDGTAWATINITPLVEGDTLAARLQSSKEDLQRRGIPILSERQVQLAMGRATRREIEIPVAQATSWASDISPTNSQALDRQYQYILQIGTDIYTLTFDAQAADFEGYKPIFQAMALSFSIG